MQSKKMMQVIFFITEKSRYVYLHHLGKDVQNLKEIDTRDTSLSLIFGLQIKLKKIFYATQKMRLFNDNQ